MLNLHYRNLKTEGMQNKKRLHKHLLMIYIIYYAALIVGSLDPCYSCTDRVTVTDVAAKRDHVLDKEQFENVWRDKSPLAGEGTMAAPLDEEAL